MSQPIPGPTLPPLRRLVAAWCALGTLGALDALGGGGLGAEARAATADPLSLVVVAPSTNDAYDQTLGAFLAALEAGGVHVRVSRVSVDASGAPDAGALADAVRREGAQLVLTLGQGATHAATHASLSVPIVAGLIVDAADLDGAPNATGVTLSFDLEAQIHLLQEILPDTKSIGVVFDPRQNAGKVREAQRIGARLGLQIVDRPVASAREIPAALRSLSNSVSVMLGLPDSLVLTPETAREVLLFSFRNRIPFVGPSASWAKAGALYAMHWDYADMGRQLAELALSLRQGAPIASLAPRGPRKALFTLNGKTADQLGVTLPAAIRARAHQVL
ncbi:MAG: ABC transporter substrate binding protein [Myxococcota bacterium]